MTLLVSYEPSTGKYTVRLSDDQLGFFVEGDSLYQAIDDLESRLAERTLGQESQFKKARKMNSIQSKENVEEKEELSISQQ